MEAIKGDPLAAGRRPADPHPDPGQPGCARHPGEHPAPLAGLLFVLMVLAISQLGSRLQTLKLNIDALSAGDADLTARIQVKGHDELDNIALSVNRFIAFLQQMMVQVTAATDLITRELAQLDQQTGQARRILGEHASETDQVVTALNELSSTADSVARHANDSASFTEAANGQAASSRKWWGQPPPAWWPSSTRWISPPPRCWRCRKMPSRSAACSG